MPTAGLCRVWCVDAGRGVGEVFLVGIIRELRTWWLAVSMLRATYPSDRGRNMKMVDAIDVGDGTLPPDGIPAFLDSL